MFPIKMEMINHHKVSIIRHLSFMSHRECEHLDRRDHL